jgi:hypothetical protein
MLPVFEERARADGVFAIAYALLRVADAQQNMAAELRRLGIGDAASTEGVGAIEGFGMLIGAKLDALTEALASRDQ